MITSGRGHLSTVAGSLRSRPTRLLLLLFATFLIAPVSQAAAESLTVHLGGSGGGKVTTTDGFIDCSNVPGEEASACSTNEYIAKATLEATAGPGVTFLEWTGTGSAGGCATGTENPCETGFILFGGADITAVFGTQAEPPEVSIAPVTAGGIAATEATVEGTVNPNGNEVTACAFEYLDDEELTANPPAEPFAGAQTVACEPGPGPESAGIGAGTAPVAVHARLSGLQAATEYHVRLTARNATNHATTVEPNPTFTTTAVPPSVTTGRSWSVTDTSATLSGEVNPGNTPTSYHFEYVSEAGFLREGFASAISTAAQELAAGGEGLPVFADVAGLEAGTGYRFRLVADNGVEAAPGETAVAGAPAPFATRTFAEVSFPQRGYELVSAADTNGIDAQPTISSTDGEDYSYFTYIPAPGAPNGNTYAPVRAVRNPDGSWSQAGVGIPPRPGEKVTQGPTIFSVDDLSLAALTFQQGVDPDDRNGVGDAYLQDLDGGGTTWLSRIASIPPGTAQTAADGTGGVEPGEVVYISPDGDTVLFESSRHLLPTDTSAPDHASLYQWTRGRLTLVGILPGQTKSSPLEGSELGSQGKQAVGNGSTYGAVSADGSRVVFQALEEGGRGLLSHLYVRLDGDRAVEASRSVGISPEVTEPYNVTFWGADENDELVYFTSSSALTPDSSAPNEPLPSSPKDLYVYDTGEGTLHDLAPFAGGAAVSRVYAVSDDGHRVYFSADRRLTPGQGDPNGPNLYLAEVDDRGQLTAPLKFVAEIAPEEEEQVEGGEGGGMAREQQLREAATDPHGNLLAFRDSLNLVPGRRTDDLPQVYVYDAVRNELSCASCPTDGSAPSVAANLVPSRTRTRLRPGGGLIHEIVPIDGNAASSSYLPHSRNVSEDGSVYFQTATPLVAGDTNGAIDVYEDRGNRVGLVSTGRGAQDAAFGDASADGTTVFFASPESLLAEAQQGAGHVYAARVGVPNFSRPTPAPPCSGEGCRGAVGLPAPTSSAGTALFAGPANPHPKHKKPRRHKKRKRHHARRKQGRKVHGGRHRSAARAGHSKRAHGNQGGAK